jgi:hypothetical protein
MTTAQTNQREFLNFYHFLKFTFEEIFVYFQTLSHNTVSSTPRRCGIQTHNVTGDRH